MIATREQLKIWFRKGLYPLESQFHAWIDSFWHKSEKLPMSQIEGLAEAINGKADASVIDTKQNKTDDSLQTQNKTVTGAINEIKNNLDDATLSSGRLNTIDNEGHINSSLVQGDGISIDDSSGTISVVSRDKLFEQADSSRGNLCDIYDMSIKTTAYGEDQTPMPILEAAEAMPVDYEINLTNSDVVKFSIPGIIDQNAGQCNNDGLTFTTNSYQTYFHGEKLQGHYDRNKYYFDIKVDLSNITSKTLACLIDRLIIASSPWKSAQYYDEQNRNILLKAANQNFCTTRKAIDIPEESALLVYKDYNQTTRLMDRLIFYRGGNIKGSPSWPYIFYSESEAGSISGDSYARKFLMGKTYAQIRNLVGGDEAGATMSTFYSIIGRFKIAIEGNYNGVLYDAFFGCFPWCLVEAAFIDNGVLIIRMCTYQESLYSTAMPVPNMRMILPKNEIINKIKNMLDNGEIDQFGNPLT